MKQLLDFKKLITVLLAAAVTATAGAFIDVQIMKSKFEAIIDDVKMMKSDVKDIKDHLIGAKNKE